MLNHSPRISRQPTHRTANMRINLHDLLYRVRVQQGRLGALLNGEDDSFRGLDTNCCGAEFDGFDGVFDWVGGKEMSVPCWARVGAGSRDSHLERAGLRDWIKGWISCELGVGFLETGELPESVYSTIVF